MNVQSPKAMDRVAITCKRTFKILVIPVVHPAMAIYYRTDDSMQQQTHKSQASDLRVCE